ncbi:hypothetical protein AAE02nite_35470 [Adhaeribacter aerolatus]|uniref:Uncharacterized protein n=1 Tax=Adhaeribacter aerolatus TaxID=670289 RepID=A0A512B1P5_9BACT|nr:hypothetical protein [Adhaeribacter aerolatus]GEO05883.1 hypothetical protein AAE02nite_35470 [Adhaeribacter aerolatus]
MKCEVTLVFEENDGTLKWLFNIISYAHHISEPRVQKMLEPMLKEFLHDQSYQQLIKLTRQKISEEELVVKHLQNGLIKFSSSQVKVRGPKIKAMCYMIEQAGTMQAAAEGEDVPDYILNLFEGHALILNRIKEVVSEALKIAGAKGVQIAEFNSQ